MRLETAAVIVLRIKEPQMVRPYRTWGYPVVPVVFIVGALALTLNSLIEAPLRSAFAFGVMSIGMIFYARWRSREHRPFGDVGRYSAPSWNLFRNPGQSPYQKLRSCNWKPRSGNRNIDRPSES